MRPANVKEGDLFRYKPDQHEKAYKDNAPEGCMLRLRLDDGSSCPLFEPVGWKEGAYYENFSLLERVPLSFESPHSIDFGDAPINLTRALDIQVGGGHYKDMAIQPIEYILGNNIGFCEGAAIKYLSRWKQKGGVEDLRKAKHFIDLLIESEVSL